MPIVQVTSLPFEPPIDLPDVLRGVTEDFVAKTGIAREHVTMTWNVLPPGHYAQAGVTPVEGHQPPDSHPLLVELSVPDLYEPSRIEELLEVTARCLAERTGVELTNVFVQARTVRSGAVFEAGQIIRW